MGSKCISEIEVNDSGFITSMLILVRRGGIGGGDCICVGHY